MGPGGVERRKWPRLDSEVDCIYRAAEGLSLDHLTDFRNARIANVSARGVCFETDRYTPAGSIIEFKAEKADCWMCRTSRPVSAKGKVVWIKLVDGGRYRFGLEFEDIDEDLRKEIVSHIEKNLKSQE